MMYTIIHDALPVGILFKIKDVGIAANGKQYLHVHSVGYDNPRLELFVWSKDNCLGAGDFCCLETLR